MNQLEVQFHTDSASGPYTVRKPFSVMTAYSVPRDKIKEASGMKGIERYGIYCLTGEGKIYIGQTSNGIGRIREHTRGKQFWDKAILFLADQIHFNLNIISGLERHAIEEAFKNSPYSVENKSVPKYETISSFEKEQILTIYKEIEFIMNFLGVQTKKEKESTTSKEEEVVVEDRPVVFHTKKHGTKGLLSIIDGSFVVLEGSVIVIDKPIVGYPSCQAARETAIKNGILKKIDGSNYLLKENVQFTSPSSAAVFVLGRASNGKNEWVDDQNQTLGSYISPTLEDEE